MKYIVEMCLNDRWQYNTSADSFPLAELLAQRAAVVIVFKNDKRIRLKTRVRDNNTNEVVARFC